jgi:hypothetical protein
MGTMGIHALQRTKSVQVVYIYPCLGRTDFTKKIQ